MITKNQMSYKSYWLCIGLADVVGLVLYSLYVFSPIPGKGTLISEIILILMVVVFTGFFGYVNDDEERNIVRIIINAIFPFGMYCQISNFRVISANLSLSILIMETVFTLVLFLPLLAETRSPRERRRAVVRFWSGRVFELICDVIAVTSLIFIIYSILETRDVLKPQINGKLINGGSSVETSIADNMDTLCLLEPTKWEALSESEKLDVCRKIAAIESDCLGIPYSIKVKVSDGEITDGAVSCYGHAKHLIMIDKEFLASATSRQICNSICHEAYHGYQHCLVEAYDSMDRRYKDLYMFDTVMCYKLELMNYKNGNEDYKGYAEQYCEQSACEYAEYATNDYFEKIENYSFHLNEIIP